MAEVGRIQIEVDARQAEKAVRTLNQMGVQAQKTGRKVNNFEKETKQATRATDKMANSSRKLSRMFGLLSAGIGGLTFIGLAREIGQATTQLNNIEATMRVATGSAAAASQQLGFIREEAQRLGLFFPAVAKQMAQFSAAARGTSITGQELRTIFTGISEASRAMGLTAPQAEGAMMALQQMMSKGKVSAEELRQQLGERMPGSIQIMAQSLDVTTQQLFKMMENGELLSDEVLPKFGRELQKVFGREATQQADRLAASVDRLRNSFFDLLSQDQGLPGASSAINELAVVVGSSQFQKSFDAIVQSISEFMRVIADNLDHLIQLSKVLASVGIGLFAKRVATSSANLLTMAGSMNVANTSLRSYNALTAVAVASSNALAASISRIIWPLALVSGTVAAYKMFSDSSEEAEHKTANLRAEIEGLQKGFIDTSIASLEYQRSLARPDFSEFIRQSKELAALQKELQDAQERQEDRGFLDITFGEESVATLKQQIRELKNRRSELEENTTFYAELTKRIEEQRDALQEAEDAADDHSEALNALAELDPVFDASKQLREELADIDMIVEQLGISEQKTAELREDAYNRYEKNVSDAIGSTDDLTKSYEELRAELDDGFAALVTYQETVKEIVANVDDPEKIAELIGLAKEEYIEATTEAKKLGDESSKAAQKIEEDFTRVADSIEREFSDAFVNIFEDGLDSFDDLADGITDIFKRTLADMAAAAIRQQIIIPITQQVVGGTGDIISGTGQLLSGGGVGGIGRALTSPGFGGNLAGQFAMSGMGQSLGLSGATAGMQGGAGAMGGQTLTGTGRNLVGTASAATSLAGMGGNLIGTQLGGGTAEASAGATVGQIAGAFVGGPVGSFVGAALGGFVGGLFGDDEPDPSRLSVRTGGTRGSTRGVLSSPLGQAENQQLVDTIFDSIRDYIETVDGVVQDSLNRSLSSVLGGETVSVNFRNIVEDFFTGDDANPEKGLNLIFKRLSDRLGDRIPGIFGDALNKISNSTEGFGERFDAVANVITTASDPVLKELSTFAEKTEATGNQFVQALTSLNQALGVLEITGNLTDVSNVTGSGSFAQNIQQFAQSVLSVEEIIRQFEPQSATVDRARESLFQFTQSAEFLGQGVIRTADDFITYIQSLDLTSEKGRDAAASALQYADAVATVDREQQRITQERERLERELLQIQGDTLALRERELEELDPTNRELQIRIFRLQDEQEILQTRERLEQSLLEAYGRSATLIRRQVEGLTDENAALQIAISLRENVTEAEQMVAQAEQNLAGIYQDQASTADELASAWQSATQSLRESADDLLGIGDGSQLGVRTRFQQALQQALSGNREAFDELPELAEELSGLERSGAGSLSEVRRANAQIARQLNRAADFAEQQSLEQLSQRDLAQKQLETLVDQELTMEQAQENLSESQDALKAAQDASTEAINKIGELLPNSIVNGLMEPLSPLEQIKASTSEMVKLLAGADTPSGAGGGGLSGGVSSGVPEMEPSAAADLGMLGREPAIKRAAEAVYYSTSPGGVRPSDVGINYRKAIEQGKAAAGMEGSDWYDFVWEFLNYKGDPQEFKQYWDGFAEGGIARGPESGFTARLHGTEAVIPLNGERIPLEVDNSEMIQELRELRTEVKQLKENQEQSQYQIAKNTKRTKDTLEQFDIEGLPPERSEV